MTLDKEHSSEAHEYRKKKDFLAMKTSVLSLLQVGAKRDKPDYSMAAELIADHLVEFYFFKTIKHDEKPTLYYYENGIYIPNGKTRIQEMCRRVRGEGYTAQFANLVINKVAVDTYIDEKTFFESQNNYPFHIPVQNGILDLKNKILEDFTPSIYFFNKLPVAYNKLSKCPKIIDFFNQILTEEKDILTIQEIFGFSLIKIYLFKKAFIFYSPDGDSGKTQAVDLLLRLIGINNYSCIQLQQLENTNKSFCIAQLHNKLVNVGNELTKASIGGGGVLKYLTGRDAVSSDRKYLDYLNFVNYAKMIFTGNELPQPMDLTEAFFGRFIVIEFPYRFLTQKEIDRLTPEERKNVKLQNPNVLDEILNTNIETTEVNKNNVLYKKKTLDSDSELEGLLNWSIEGLQRLLTNKAFTSTKTSKEVKKAWLLKTSSFSTFSEELLIEDYDGEIETKTLHKLYLDYCKTNKVRPENTKRIKEILSKEFGCTKEQRYPDGKRVFVWTGIKLKELRIDPQF